MYDAADVIDPGDAVGIGVTQCRQRLLSGGNVAWRDEQVGIRIKPLLAGLVEKRRERGALEQQHIDAGRFKGG